MDEINLSGPLSQRELAASIGLLPNATLAQCETPADSVLVAAVRKEIVRYGVNIAEWGLLIQQGTDSEVMQTPAIWTLPGAPPWMLGLINLRGNLVPIYELRPLLDLAKRKLESKPLVLIFDQGDRAVGILIDDYPEPLSALHPLPNLPQLPASLSGHVHKAYVKDEMIWLEFDHHSFFEKLLGIVDS